MSVVSYINHQGGVSSKRLFILAERLLEWAQLNLRSLRAAHLPGRLNQGADMLSRSNVPSEEWMLHPQTVQKIWKTFGKAEVDLFASKDSSHCPTYYSKDRDRVGPRLAQPPPLCIPPDRPVREQGHKVLLVAPLWRNQPWLSELTQLLTAAPWPVPWDGISSLRWTEQYGTLDPSCGLSTFGRSTGAYRPPGASVKRVSKNLRSLSLKTALLLALASVKRVGDLQALSISPACLEFGPNDSKVVLKPRHGYVPKVLSTPFRAQVITLSALPPSEEDRELSLLCPVRALRIYFERSAPFRRT